MANNGSSSVLRSNTLFLLLVTASFAVFSATVAKSPLDVLAPIDTQAAVTRLVGVGPIDKFAGSFAAVGPWGKILVSGDSGKSWKQSPAPVSSDLNAVSFPTPKKGWIVGHDGVVLHTDDGGKSWVRQLDGRQYGDIMIRYYESLAQKDNPKIVRALDDARRFKEDGADKPFLDVYFENDHSGWVVGSFNLILKTDDAGKTWQPWIDRIDNDNAYSLYAIGASGDEIYIVGELGLVERLDRQRGSFVQLKTSYAGSFFGLVTKPNFVLIFGLRGNAFRSRDAGKTWQKVETGLNGGIVSGTFLEDGRLILGDNTGAIVLSPDDGDHFSRVTIGKLRVLNGITAVAEKRVLVVGDGGVSVEIIK